MRSLGSRIDRQRDDAKQSQEEGTEAMASRWTIQVSSTSSESNSSRPVNDHGSEPDRCVDRRAGDTQRVDSGEQGRIAGLRVGRTGPLDGAAIRPPGTATKARMMIHTVLIERIRPARVYRDGPGD